MTDLRTAAKQALEALEWHENQPTLGAFAGRADALRAALEQDAVERGEIDKAKYGDLDHLCPFGRAERAEAERDALRALLKECKKVMKANNLFRNSITHHELCKRMSAALVRKTI